MNAAVAWGGGWSGCMRFACNAGGMGWWMVVAAARCLLIEYPAFY